MTIATSARKVIGVGNGATTIWPFGFIIPDAASLNVVWTDISGVDHVLPTSTFSVTGLGNADGGNVTYPLSGPNVAAGEFLTVYRQVAYVQETQINNQGAFYPDVLENVFDYSMMADQQLAEVTSRMLQFPITDINPLVTLPGAALRANSLLGFDSAGAPALFGKSSSVPTYSSSVGAIQSVAALKALTPIGQATAQLLGYSAAGDEGGGAYYWNSTDTRADDGGSVIASNAGGIGRWNIFNNASGINVKQYGAKGNNVQDDITFINKAIAAALVFFINGTVLFPPGTYKTTAPMVGTQSVKLIGAGANATTIMATGMAVGQLIIDFNCAAIDIIEHVNIESMTLRSNNGSPDCLRLKNVSYFTSRDLRLYNGRYGIVMDGTRCFTHNHYNLVGYQLTGNTVNWLSTFAGGGQFNFNGCTLAGADGGLINASAVTDAVNFNSCNFEGCTTSSFSCFGTCAGLTFNGGRTEGCTNRDIYIRPFGAGEFVNALTISGMTFSASNSGGINRVVLGGDAGKIHGFSVISCTVKHGTNLFAANLVQLNGDGQSGVVFGNVVHGTTGSGAGVVDSQRPGVIVAANENLTGALPEWWGQAVAGITDYAWTPADGSGAGLVFAAAGGNATQNGRYVYWQAIIKYPATADGTAASFTLDVLPSVTVAGATQGRAGGRVDVSDAGIALGLLQGLPAATKIAFYNPTANTTIANSALSGKTMYMSGQYLH